MLGEPFLFSSVARRGRSGGGTSPPPPPAGFQATGGTETVIAQDGRFYRLHRFHSSDTLSVLNGGTAEYLIVAGGGPGGNQWGFAASGGGGRGDVLAGALTLVQGHYPVTVGTAGLAAERSSGGKSAAFGLVALGGGPGAARISNSGPSAHLAAEDGGGGNGSIHPASEPGAPHPTAFRGGDGRENASNPVERAGGGGAGAAGDGTHASPSRGGDGGPGLQSSITGVMVEYGRGGGGGRRGGNGGAPNGASGQAPGGAGTNPGDGGGGAASSSFASPLGGDGGPGLVILRYEITEAAYLAHAG